MRVILKPAGLLFVLLAFGGLASIVAFDRVAAKSDPKIESNLEQLHLTLSKQKYSESNSKTPHIEHLLLENSGFEGGFQSIGKADAGRGTATTHRGGVVAFPWRDDSDWADVSVSYAQETQSVHGGNACQRVMVQAVRSGAVQMVQQVPLKKGETYRASCWMKSDRPLTVEVGLRLMSSPFTYYGLKRTTIGTEWTQVTVDAPAPRRDPALFVLRLYGPSNLLIDDAELKRVTGDTP